MDTFSSIFCEGEYTDINSITPTIEYDDKLMNHLSLDALDLEQLEVDVVYAKQEEIKEEVCGFNFQSTDLSEVSGIEEKEKPEILESEVFSPIGKFVEIDENRNGALDNHGYEFDREPRKCLINDFSNGIKKTSCCYNLRYRVCNFRKFDSKRKGELPSHNTGNSLCRPQDGPNIKREKSGVPVLVYKFSPEVKVLPHISCKAAKTSLFTKKERRFLEEHSKRLRLSTGTGNSLNLDKKELTKSSRNRDKIPSSNGRTRGCIKGNDGNVRKRKRSPKLRKVKANHKRRKLQVFSQRRLNSESVESFSESFRSSDSVPSLEKYNFVVVFNKSKTSGSKCKGRKVHNSKPRSGKVDRDCYEEESLLHVKKGQSDINSDCRRSRRSLKKLSESEVKLIVAPSGKYGCSSCSYRHKERHHVETHIFRHLGYKKFSCDVCSYSSIDKSHLSRHMRIHTGEKPHKCYLCSYASIQKVSLNIHLQKNH